MNVRFFLTAGVGAWVRFLYLRRFARKYLLRRRGHARPRRGVRGRGIPRVARPALAGSELGWLRHLHRQYVLEQPGAGEEERRLHERATRPRDLKVLDDRSVFDVVYSIDVLEHIPGNETVMRNIFDALKEDGLFYLAMPYDRERPTVLPARYQEKFTAWADEEHVGEMRSLPETEAVLRKIGFTVLESRYTFGFFARLAWELAQYTKALRGGRVFSRAAKPLLNGLATLEFISSKPDDGNVLIVCQK